MEYSTHQDGRLVRHDAPDLFKGDGPCGSVPAGAASGDECLIMSSESRPELGFDMVQDLECKFLALGLLTALCLILFVACGSGPSEREIEATVEARVAQAVETRVASAPAREPTSVEPTPAGYRVLIGRWEGDTLHTYWEDRDADERRYDISFGLLKSYWEQFDEATLYVENHTIAIHKEYTGQQIRNEIISYELSSLYPKY